MNTSLKFLSLLLFLTTFGIYACSYETLLTGLAPSYGKVTPSLGLLGYEPLEDWTLLNTTTSAVGDACFPRIRHAYSLVLTQGRINEDSSDGSLYIFGGNLAGISPSDDIIQQNTTTSTTSSNVAEAAIRLNDFWALRLKASKSGSAALLKCVKYLVRKQVFLEMTNKLSQKQTENEDYAKEIFKDALHFLQDKLCVMVDTHDPLQVAEFSSLAPFLFEKLKENNANDNKSDQVQVCTAERKDLLEKLLSFFPPSFKRPTQSLESLIMQDWN